MKATRERPRIPMPIRRARAALLWERLWPAVLAVLIVVALFLSVALADLLPRTPVWLHVLALAAFAAALAAVVARGILGFRAVNDGEARHRLEIDNALSHRPLTALEDHLAAGDDDARTRALWRAHLARMARLARGLKVRIPSPGMARRDPQGLRAAVLLLLVVALAVGVGDPWERLGRALMPRVAGAAEQPVSVDVWITPPAYTRMAPLFLAKAQGVAAASLKVPVGSAVLAQVAGLAAPPTLRIGERAVAFEILRSATGQRGFRVESQIEGAGRLAVEHRGREIAAWTVEAIPDRPPSVALSAPPEATPRNYLRLDYEARDDYGLAKVSAEIRRAERPDEGELRLELPLPALAATAVKSRAVRDLTPHPWAGLPVRIRLVAVDGIGQSAATDDVDFVLPEREFRHPVARALIEERKRLSTPSPTTRARVSAGIAAIAGRPDLFSHDTVVFLALAVAHARLLRDETEGALPSVQAILWDTALRLEEGDMSVAERRLLRAQDELARAMQDGTPPAEIERLMDELQRALDEFMQALAEQLMRDGGFEIPLLPDMEMISRSDLQEILSRARDLARMGSMDAARQMIAQLRRMIENLRAGVRPSMMNQGMARAQEMMNQMRQLIERQERLLDRTFRRAQQQPPSRGPQGQRGQPGQRGEAGQEGEMPEAGEGDQGEADAAEQEALRQMLADMMAKMKELFGGSPEAMGRAERAMQGAAGELGANRPGPAVPLQTEALEQLRQGMQGAMEQMARAMGGFIGLGLPGTQMPPVNPTLRPPTRDPFGRAPEGNFGSAIEGDVKVPEEMEIRRAHEILDELRRRANQRSRPPFEREYIDRLLRQF